MSQVTPSNNPTQLLSDQLCSLEEIQQVLILNQETQEKIQDSLAKLIAINRQNLDEIPEVDVVDVGIPFGSMFIIVLKWTIASALVGMFFVALIVVISVCLTLLGVAINLPSLGS